MRRRKPNPSDETRVHTGLPPSGEPVSSFYDRSSRRPAASLMTEWDDRVVAVRSDRVRWAYNRRRDGDLDVGASTLAAQRIRGVSV